MNRKCAGFCLAVVIVILIYKDIQTSLRPLAIFSEDERFVSLPQAAVSKSNLLSSPNINNSLTRHYILRANDNDNESLLPKINNETTSKNITIRNFNENTRFQHLLDVAIIGHAKCGTSTLIHWLDSTEKMTRYKFEKCFSHLNFVSNIQWEYNGNQRLRYYSLVSKCPKDIWNQTAVQNGYGAWFPSTKLMIGIRHPILWFESMYNFRQWKNNISLPHPNTLVKCTNESIAMGWVCAHRIRYHETLKNLFLNGQKAIPNPVFIYDVKQLEGSTADNTSRTRQFAKDIQDFLQLDKPLPVPIPQINRASSNDVWMKSKLISICNNEYSAIRQELLEIGRIASSWIQAHIVPRPSEFVISAPEYFQELLESYKSDPCESRI